jgi:hypothetical protein
MVDTMARPRDAVQHTKVALRRELYDRLKAYIAAENQRRAPLKVDMQGIFHAAITEYIDRHEREEAAA